MRKPKLPDTLPAGDIAWTERTGDGPDLSFTPSRASGGDGTGGR